ncbi:DUF1848 domain-containing protein [Geoalkalibacter halelectricus]|uniref:DUF1848 domain-containing protein n=1 Tax=Geoalkalibacter halelectricus TaxID=2847045 RepID=A0ABY5ZLU9_9BACT|nr:DUF1848 domain-containing protein [Geoalkalibacter halelectricus]MDO3378571.1 DUF1848 domain-containing protein [Geoalkalibacter halelectricus]UWZ80115.1 DUF1848 domain-containing protein [Geoalkalibacter halelectricus]
MHIISASRRTDIPAFYTPWLLERLRAGHVEVPNPFNPHQVRRVDLRPQAVAGIVFWSKDPRPLLPHVADLDRRGYTSLFHITLTALPAPLEPRVPPPEEILAAVEELADKIGPQRLIWRFDPIVLSSLTPEERIISAFASLAEALQGKVRHCVISFARYYRQVQARLRRAPALEVFDPDRHDAAEALKRLGPLAAALAREGARRDLEVVSCAEPLDLSPFGVRPAACIDAALLGELFGVDLPRRKDGGQRLACRCSKSIDIGIYGTCRHGCLYCYARGDSALTRGLHHDPRATRLVTKAAPREVENPG